MPSARVRVSVACSLIVSLTTGCLTPLVTDRWSGRDRVSAVGFRLGGAAVVRWTVRAGDRERDGRFEIPDFSHECDALSLFAYDEAGSVHRLSEADWTWAMFSPGVVGRYRFNEHAAPCDVAIFVDTVGSDRDPLISLRLGGKHFARMELKPPRRHGMLAVYPFAAIGDAIGILTGAFVVLYLLGGPSWHTATKDHGVEHHHVPEDETVGQSPDRQVYP